jgi:hypothetical protein
MYGAARVWTQDLMFARQVAYLQSLYQSLHELVSLTKFVLQWRKLDCKNLKILSGYPFWSSFQDYRRQKIISGKKAAKEKLGFS